MLLNLIMRRKLSFLFVLAVLIVPLYSPLQIAEVSAAEIGDRIIVDNTDSGFSYTPSASWTDSTSGPGYYGTNYKVDATGTSDTGLAAKWTPALADAGFYKIYMWWTEGSDRPDAAPIEIKYENGYKIDDSITVDQTINGGQWVYLGTYYMGTGGYDYVKIKGDDEGYVAADAVMFQLSYKMGSAPVYWPEITPEPAPTPLPLNTEIIIDNSDPEFSTYMEGNVSAWPTSSSAPGFVGTNYALCNAKGNWNFAKYNPVLTTPGTYEVFVNWTAYTNRADQAGVVIGHKGGVDTTKTVDMTTNGGQWISVGQYPMQGAGKDYVSLVCDDDGYVVADAVKFKLISYASEPPASSPQYTGVRKVAIVQDGNGNFGLTVDGVPFDVKGVAGAEVIDEIADAGGNAVRTYDASDKHMNGWEVLDEAEANGVKVVIGLWIEHYSGDDFINQKAKVQTNLDQLKAYVDKYKDHPAVLAWGVGNEVDKTTSPREVYDAINHLAQYIKDQDKNHPTMIVLAGSSPTKVVKTRHYAPAIDIISVNSYKHIGNVHENVTGTLSGQGNWIGPYMITEFGADQSSTSLNESAKTTWGVTLEHESYYKELQYINRYTNHIAPYNSKLIGSFVFKGADVVGMTHTWYNMFLENHTQKSGIYDAMYKAWNGSYPADRAPGVKTITINAQYDDESVVLAADTDFLARITIDTYGESDTLTYVWELREEYKKGATGYPGDVIATNQGPNPSFTWDKERRQIRTPSVPGYYRLFAYVYDQTGHVGTASIPFKVE
ncbi:golvesin C-terminal-like domain-containing protein [Paenibacillus chungangensis]|uniref:Glycoside hydrolase family 2 TIM barrel-domain containing protein n=1 Tax=Paenibacillus chungangensis TaxID=696535 RepID=A0ABW3HU47_9BACL